MTRWMIYSVQSNRAGERVCTIEKCPLKPSDDPHLVCRWRGGKLLGVQVSKQKAESFRRLIELQASLQGFAVQEA